MVKNNNNNINVKNELEQMLKRKDIWEMNNETIVNNYYERRIILLDLLKRG